MSDRPKPMTTIRLSIHHRDDETGDITAKCDLCTYEGMVLKYDESGEFALIAWEDGTRDYRYIHKGYDAQMNETLEW